VRAALGLDLDPGHDRHPVVPRLRPPGRDARRRRLPADQGERAPDKRPRRVRRGRDLRRPAAAARRRGHRERALARARAAAPAAARAGRPPGRGPAPPPGASWAPSGVRPAAPAALPPGARGPLPRCPPRALPRLGAAAPAAVPRAALAGPGGDAIPDAALARL